MTQIKTAAEKKSGRIEIDIERCKGCELCTTACPHSLISMAEDFNAQGYHFAVFMNTDGRCNGCALCAEMCPDIAIEVYR
jgi:2-oxoglutarate ferredoxin oxidoreductase subunit delta